MGTMRLQDGNSDCDAHAESVVTGRMVAACNSTVSVMLVGMPFVTPDALIGFSAVFS